VAMRQRNPAIFNQAVPLHDAGVEARYPELPLFADFAIGFLQLGLVLNIVS
jgi:hypothetical protein